MTEYYRKAYIYKAGLYAGILKETDDGYRFTYDETYLSNQNKPISLSMPLNKKSYVSNYLFPFFDGLIPEGWLLKEISNKLTININDKFGLLLVACKDVAGDVSIQNIKL